MLLFSLVGKNLKVLLRSKSSASIVLLGPILIMILAGLAFDHHTEYRFTVGVRSDTALDGQYDGRSGTQEFIDELKEDFNVEHYGNRNDCLKAVISGRIHACVDFPEGFSDVGDSQQTIGLYTDGSKFAIVESVTSSLEDTIRKKGRSVSAELTSSLLEGIDDANTALENLQDRQLADLQIHLLDFQRDFSVIKTQLRRLEIQSSSGNTLPAYSSAGAQAEVDALYLFVSNALDDLEQNMMAISALAQANPQMSAAAADGLRAARDFRREFQGMQANRSSGELHRLLGSIVQEAQQAQSQLALVKNTSQGLDMTIDVMSVNLESMIAQIDESMRSAQIAFDSLSSSSVRNAQVIAVPYVIERNDVVQARSKLIYLLPVLLCLVVLFSSMLLSSIFVVLEKKSPASFRNFAAPVGNTIQVFSVLVTTTIILLVQAIISFGITILVFSLPVSIGWVYGIAVVLLCVGVFSSIGMMVGYIFSTEQTSTIAASCLASIFLVFSEVFLPLEALPATFKTIVSYSPFVLSVDLLREVIIFHQQPDLFKIGLLFCYATIFFLGVVSALKTYRLLNLVYYTKLSKKFK